MAKTALTPDEKTLAPIRRERDTTANQILAYEITDDAGRVELSTLLLGLKALKKAIVGHYAPIKKAIREGFNDAIGKVTTMEDTDLNPVLEAETKGSAKILAWLAEEEKRRAEEIARREAEARRLAEEEKAREVEELRRQAETAKKSGDEDMAAALRQTANAVKATEVAPSFAPVAAPQKVKGISTVVTWNATCHNKMALVRAVAAGQVSLDALDVNQSWLKRKATADKADFNVPGCTAMSNTGLRGRTA